MKQKRTQIETVCSKCGISFLKAKSELDRNNKLGKNSYCSRTCRSKHNCNHLKEYHGKFNDHLIKNKRDEFSDFRCYLSESRQRSDRNGKGFDITLQHLKEIWIKQDAICPYSGVKLNLVVKNTRKKQEDRIKNNPITTASLDRIDSSKGYIIGNVQFVSVSINYMKSNMTHEQTIELCKLIASNHGQNRIS